MSKRPTQRSCAPAPFGWQPAGSSWTPGGTFQRSPKAPDDQAADDESDDDFDCALFATGRLVITTEEGSLDLTPKQTKRLFDYLDLFVQNTKENNK